METNKEKTIIIKVPYEIYLRLRERSKAEGYNLLSDYVKAIILKELGLEPYASRLDMIEERISKIEESVKEAKYIDTDKIENKILRKVQDLINPVSAEITKLSNRIADLVERIEKIEDKIEEIEKKLAKPVEAKPARETHRKTGIERLREEGVLFESELKWLRNKDRFFAYLEREGAKIIEAAGERIAVDIDFWEKFKRKMFKEITTSSEDQIKIVLNKTEYKLFQKLKNSGLIYYDSTEHKWKPVSKELL